MLKDWGCGVFNGNKPLKALLQVMAATVVGRDLIYYTFREKATAQEISEFFQLLEEKAPTVGQLWSLIESFDYEKDQNIAEYAKKYFKEKKCIVS
jgi:poly(ADP-ribose) glycohydrolase